MFSYFTISQADSHFTDRPGVENTLMFTLATITTKKWAEAFSFLKSVRQSLQDNMIQDSCSEFWSALQVTFMPLSLSPKQSKQISSTPVQSSLPQVWYETLHDTGELHLLGQIMQHIKCSCWDLTQWKAMQVEGSLFDSTDKQVSYNVTIVNVTLQCCKLYTRYT